MTAGRARSIVVCMLGVVCLLLPSCDGVGPGDGGSMDPLDSDVIFTVRESHPAEDSGPVIVARFETEKIYSCFNYGIVVRQVRRNNEIQFVFEGIYKPNICLTATGPARTESILDIGPGTYRLAFFWKGDADLYDLTVTEKSIAVETRKSEFTSTQQELTWRYPPKSFAYVCGTTVETDWIYEDFRDSLLTIPGVSSYVFPDSGAIPYPDSSSGHWDDHPALYFSYDDEADFSAAGEKLKAYSREVVSQHTGVGIYLVNWRNQQYMSWLFTSRGSI